MKISDLKIEKINHTGKGEKFYITGSMGNPLGGMYDFYSYGSTTPPAVLRNPYPFWNGQNGTETLEECEDLLKKVKNHMMAVIELPSQSKIGSSRYWKE